MKTPGLFVQDGSALGRQKTKTQARGDIPRRVSMSAKPYGTIDDIAHVGVGGRAAAAYRG